VTLSAGLSLGGTLPGTSVVGGGGLAPTANVSTVVETRGERLYAPLSLTFYELAAFGRYYFREDGGFHVGAGFGAFPVEVEEHYVNDPQPGPDVEGPFALSLSPEVGYAFWIKMKIRGGVVARANLARWFGDTGDATYVAPVLLASLTFN
jgi:hypothetical protein